MLIELIIDMLFRTVAMAIGGFLYAVRNLYYRLRYPNKYLRAKKLAGLDDGIHIGTKVAGWILVITVLFILLLLFYKLTGFFD